MTRRRKRLAAALLALTLAGVTAVVFWPRGPRVTRATMERVTVGMTRAEVEAAVGGPPGDYTGGWELGPDESGSRFDLHDSWVCRDGRLFVLFNRDDRASGVELVDAVFAPPPSLYERFRDWRKRNGL